MSLVVQLQCLLQLAQFRYYFDALNCVVPLIVHSMIMLLFCLQSLIFWNFDSSYFMSVPVLNAVKFGDIQNYFNCNSDFHFTGNQPKSWHNAWHMVEWHAKIMVHLLHVCEVCSIVWDWQCWIHYGWFPLWAIKVHMENAYFMKYNMWIVKHCLGFAMVIVYWINLFNTELGKNRMV